jgi:hypothetical protein
MNEASEDTTIRIDTFFKAFAEFWTTRQMNCHQRNSEKALPARVRKWSEHNRSVPAS